jgi:3-hydroxyisobutyrate dehydrogenase
MLKDVKIAVQLAEDLALPTELGGRLAELWQEALQSLAPHADHTEIAKVIMGRVSPLAGLTT